MKQMLIAKFGYNNNIKMPVLVIFYLNLFMGIIWRSFLQIKLTSAEDFVLLNN